MLGGPNLPDFSSAHRFENREDYRRLLEGVLVQVKRHAKRNASIYVRTDARHFTLGTTVEVLGDLWPRHRLSSKFDRAPGMTQTALFQDEWEKAGECGPTTHIQRNRGAHRL
jgi:hypothetical protein